MKRSVFTPPILSLITILTVAPAFASPVVSRRLEQILDKLSDPTTGADVANILLRNGTPAPEIIRFFRKLEGARCEVNLAVGGAPNPRAFREIQMARDQLSAFIDRERLEDMSAEIQDVARPDQTDEVARTLNAPPITLRIAENRFWLRKIVGLDAESLRSIFLRAVRLEARQITTHLEPGTTVWLNMARLDPRHRTLTLDVGLKRPLLPYVSMRLKRMRLTNDDTPEELASIALLTLVASPVLVDDPSAPTREARAIRSVARALLASLAAEPRDRDHERIKLQGVLDVLPSESARHRDQLSGVIVAKKRLTDYLTRAALAAKRKGDHFEVSERIYIFRPLSEQARARMAIVRPKPASGGGNFSAYDSLSCYYLPWVEHLASPWPCETQWYLVGLAQGQTERAALLTGEDIVGRADSANAAVRDEENPSPLPAEGDASGTDQSFPFSDGSGGGGGDA